MTSVEVRDVTPEKRDPTAATRSVVYQSPGQPLIPNWDAHNAIRLGYYANTFVYRCIQCKAQDISGLRVRVGADPDKPNDYDKNATTGLARLLGRRANQTTSSRKLIAWSIAQRLATGRMAWELELGAHDLPVACWPLPAPYLKAIPTESGAQYFSKFLFGKYGEEKTLMADRVFYDWQPRADDWRQPESALDAARLDASVLVMQDRYDYAFLKNDARPAAVVIYEGFATEAEDRGFKRQFNADFQGPDNAGKIAFAEADRGESGVAGAMHIETLGLSQKDARFIERYQAKLTAICVAFGVPMTRLGDASGRTFSNASEEAGIYWLDNLPLIHDIEDAWNIQLAPLFGGNVAWFDLSPIEALRPAKKFTAVEGVALYDAGTITGDELRVEVGLIEMGLGLKAAPVIPPALDKLEEKPALEAPPEQKAIEAPADEPRAIPAPDGAALIEARIAGRRASAVSTSTVQLDVLESSWTRAFTRLFGNQQRAVLARLNGKRGRQTVRNGTTLKTVTDTRAPQPDKLFQRSHWEEVTEAEAETLIAGVVAAGAGRVAGEFGVTFDLDTAQVREFIKSRANQLAGQVTDTTYAAITDQLAEGVAQGETIPELAQRIVTVFETAQGARAPMIARTEVIGAYNGSASLGAAQLPADVVGGQMWITTEDARTRPEHAAADGETVGIGEPFVGTGEPMAYPGDPGGSPGNVINCRCTVAFLTPDEMDARRMKVDTRAALAVLAMVRAGQEIDELALRRALREVRAA